MIKKHKRKNSGFMRRTSRVYLPELNSGKYKTIREFLLSYANIIRYFISVFWSKKDFTSSLADKTITDKAVEKFKITSRMAQLAAKQAKEICLSQKEKSKTKRRMPRFKNITVTLDSRFFQLLKKDNHFDWVCTFRSGFPNIPLLFKNTKHTLKFSKNDWKLGNSIRIGYHKKKKKIFIDLIFEKKKPEKREHGYTLGLDTGKRVPIATSHELLLGEELSEKIDNVDKRKKGFHHYVKTELYRIIKNLDLTGVKTICIENLKNVKKGKRGKFSRKSNRLLSFWHYARVMDYLRRLCEETGIRLELKNPWKTSQNCPVCGNKDRRNRKDEKFKCTKCGFEKHADTVGAMNLEALGLAGVYSLRSLKSEFYKK